MVGGKNGIAGIRLQESTSTPEHAEPDQQSPFHSQPRSHAPPATGLYRGIVVNQQKTRE